MHLRLPEGMPQWDISDGTEGAAVAPGLAVPSEITIVLLGNIQHLEKLMSQELLCLFSAAS